VGIRNWLLALGVGLGVWGAPLQVFAAVDVPGYEGEVETQIEFREDVQSNDSIPFDTYLKIDIRDLKGDTDLYFYGKLWKDFGYGGNWEADLYQLYVDVPFTKTARLTVGRQFISEGFETFVSDALKFEQKLESGFRYTFYIGKPRFFEPNTPDGDDFLAGFKFDYKGFFFGFQHLRNDGRLVKSSLSFGNFSYVGRLFSYYTRLEVDTAHGELVEANLGLNYFPNRKLRLTANVEYVDPTYTYGDGLYRAEPIFYLFSPQGRELRFTQSVHYDVAEGWELFESYTAVDVQREGRDNGHLLRLGVIRDRWFEEGLRWYGALLYQNSWLGILRGLELGFTKWLCERFTLRGTADIARYDKLIYGKQWANAFYLRGTYQVGDFSNLELGIDWRKNEDFERDTRLILRYNYLFWGGDKK